MKKSSIPETLKYVRKKAVEIGQYDSQRVGPSRKRMVRETFVVDANNPKTLATAEHWAKGYQQGTDNYDIVEVPNTPIEAIEIMSIAHRHRGGRAWKVLIAGAYYVDLREDVLLEALINGPGVEDSHLKGPFIWASSGSGLKLTRYKSSDHKVAEQRQIRHNTKVKKSELEIGGIYETPAGSRSIFLGYVDYDEVDDKGAYQIPGSRSYPYAPPSGAWLPNLKLTTVKKIQLWYDTYWERLGSDKQYKAGLYWLHHLKNRQMAVKVGEIKVPDDLLGTIRKHQLDHLTSELAGIAALPKFTPGCNSYPTVSDTEREKQRLHALVESWQRSTYRRPGQPRPDVPELKEIAEMSGVKENL